MAQQQAVHKFVLGNKELEGKVAEFQYDKGWYSITDIVGEERNVIYKSRNAQEAYMKWNVYIGRKKERVIPDDRRKANQEKNELGNRPQRENHETRVSFPDYSQMYVDLFQRLYSEAESQERESLLSVYSYLFTYRSAREKDNDILKSALQTSKALLQMLSNMQEGIRGYFEELSKKKTFLGIQEVLVEEINNTDSKKYAILTTTDSFYRYKEEVKELLDANLTEAQERQQMYEAKRMEIQKDTIFWHRNERLIQSCVDALDLLYLINREFDGIERRYNRLIEQKKIFAKRAAARIRYILVEGDIEEDRAKVLVKLLNVSSHKDEIIEKLGEGMRFSSSPRVIKDRSFMRPRNSGRREFMPQLPPEELEENGQLDDFVVKPLYTKGEIRAFREQNEKDGVFHVTEDTVHSVEDLEKLLFVWQEETEKYDPKTEIAIDEEFTTEEGFRYSGFTISKK